MFLLALLSPVQMTDHDPAVMLLAAQAVLDHHTLRLDGYADDAECAYDLARDERVNRQGGSLYYYSPGAQLASVPLVWVANRLGLDMLHQDEEFLTQNVASAACTALVLVLLAVIARRLAGPLPGLVIATVAVLGSPLISTLATGLWNSCYQVLLVCVSLLVLTRPGAGYGRSRVVVVLVLLGVAMLIRPSTAFLVLALALTAREIPRRAIVVAGSLGIVAAVAVVITGVGDGVLRYYSVAKLLPETPLPVGLYGTLLSPSRGLLVYSPFLLVAVVAVMIRRRQVLRHQLARTVVLWITLHVLAVSIRAVWWGGHSFGPRLMVDLMPGFVVLAALAWRELAVPRPHPRRTLVAVSCMVLAVPAIAANSYQALFNEATKQWNAWPNIDRYRSLLWSWQYPQLLATDASLEARELSLARTHLEVAHPGDVLGPSSSRLGFAGWYHPEGGWRWSRGSTSTLLLRLEGVDTEDLYLLELTAGTVGRRPLLVSVDNELVGSFELDGFAPQTVTAVVPARLLGSPDGVEVHLDTVTAARVPGDSRRLGVALRSLRRVAVDAGAAVTFRDDARFEAGFSAVEAGWRWTDGDSATLTCPVGEVAAGRSYELVLEAGSLGRQRVDVTVNGHPAGRLVLDGRARVTSRLPLPSGVLRPWALNRIRLGLPDARRTADDSRRLGVALVSVAVRPVPSGGGAGGRALTGTSAPADTPRGCCRSSARR